VPAITTSDLLPFPVDVCRMLPFLHFRSGSGSLNLSTGFGRSPSYPACNANLVANKAYHLTSLVCMYVCMCRYESILLRWSRWGQELRQRDGFVRAVEWELLVGYLLVARQSKQSDLVSATHH
jgi:hypothetical protein